MKAYWVRHRLIIALIVSVAMATITGILFVFPYISQQANEYNAQSIYKNSEVDFIAPEPSYEQISGLPGTNGINKVFPFFLTKTQVNVNGIARTTTVLLSDQFQNIDITMYNSSRLIEKSSIDYSNPIYVDWRFCKDTSAKIGDTVTFGIDGSSVDFQIYAIFETNIIYDGGAIIAEISSEQKDAIMQKSKNTGYSGMYVSASEYSTCRQYLTSDYRPMGRLKSRDSFDDEAKYQVHYDAIMSSGYANEITDFRVRESGLGKNSNAVMIWMAVALAFVLVIAFNILMARRGCEKIYFTKHCIPKGMKVMPYYSLSFVFELILFVVAYAATIVFMVMNAKEYIPKTAISISVLFVPAAVVVAEVISLIVNSIMIATIRKSVRVSKMN